MLFSSHQKRTLDKCISKDAVSHPPSVVSTLTLILHLAAVWVDFDVSTIWQAWQVQAGHVQSVWCFCLCHQVYFSLQTCVEFTEILREIELKIRGFKEICWPHSLMNLVILPTWNYY